ncbi:DUF4376 domain-containing protein [Halomonas llamarensis]|uniref:DUF4376 domain-containing protein n=1 Tax=Halomonas llamarensis TaxID=2945104 RepID=A0ABT0SRK9_9GAMM|nr:DUF4376 domain-containing protein [Halomonas llamarensis]MCL7930444.1 DUF4376 domain-containing protein [Halomonas llamarensis]
MKITWEDRKQRGIIDNHTIIDKPQLSFEYAWFLVTDDTAEYVESHEYGYWNKEMTTKQRQEVVEFYQSWAPPAPTPPTLADLKKAKYVELEQARKDAFTAGLPYEINGQPDIVQTRLQDKINLLGLRIEAQELTSAGITDPIMPFRAESNTGYQLTPQQMIDLTNAALAHIQQIYQQSWQLKDAVDNAESADDVSAIEWP